VFDRKPLPSPPERQIGRTGVRAETFEINETAREVPKVDFSE
jgi:hypothetical protein